jgi:hypothetical protein
MRLEKLSSGLSKGFCSGAPNHLFARRVDVHDTVARIQDYHPITHASDNCFTRDRHDLEKPKRKNGPIASECREGESQGSIVNWGDDERRKDIEYT